MKDKKHTDKQKFIKHKFSIIIQYFKEFMDVKTF